MKKRYLASVCAVGLLMGSQSALACVGGPNSFIKCGDEYYKLCTANEWDDLHDNFTDRYALAIAAYAGQTFKNPQAILSLGNAFIQAFTKKTVTELPPACKVLELLLDGNNTPLRKTKTMYTGFSTSEVMVGPAAIIRYTKPPS